MWILLSLAAACSDSEGVLPIGGQGGAIAGTSSVASTTSATVGETAGAGGFAPCGESDLWCGYDRFCDAPEGVCPGPQTPGLCREFTDCVDSPNDVVACGCNGQIYTSACRAQKAHTDVGPQEGCAAPSDPFACGFALCQRGEEYCEMVNLDGRCKPLPKECAATDSTCACLEPYFCFAAPGQPTCEKKADGTFTVECEVTE